MKNANQLCGFLLCIIISASCSKSNNSINSNPAKISSTLIQGNWKISLFKEDQKDETSIFKFYSFTFSNSGNVSVQSTTKTQSGSWKILVDDSQEKLQLDFTNQEPLRELNEDWEILEATTNKIRLQHISGGNGTIDFVIFEKN
ncbi:MAG: hypothetical protein IPO78_12195 [Saprospiraceae bacterium]|nr:hypothetical protein [Saprospiraceae bacterium]MBK9722358.1 hypothetical protein [Saprospiraceae bacterium]